MRSEFSTGKGTKSVDWVVVTPSAVVLIESKSARVPIEVRAGLDVAAQLVTERLSYAHTQLERTAAGIRSGSKYFAHIPNDRPLVGLVVTAEPLYMANDPTVRALLPTISIPTGTIALRDFEQLATWQPDAMGKALLAWTQHPKVSGYEIFNGLSEIGLRGGKNRNKLVDAAFLRYVGTK